MAADAKMAPEATYQAGDMKFSANVNAEYDLVTGALIGYSASAMSASRPLSCGSVADG